MTGRQEHPRSLGAAKYFAVAFRLGDGRKKSTELHRTCKCEAEQDEPLAAFAFSFAVVVQWKLLSIKEVIETGGDDVDGIMMKPQTYIIVALQPMFWYDCRCLL